MYEVIEAFPERYDKDYPYKVGDIYPRDGFAPPAGRAEELLNGTNRAGKVYLKPLAVENPTVTEEKPKPRKKKE